MPWWLKLFVGGILSGVTSHLVVHGYNYDFILLVAFVAGVFLGSGIRDLRNLKKRS